MTLKWKGRVAINTEPLFSEGLKAQPKLGGNFTRTGNAFEHSIGKEYWEGVISPSFFTLSSSLIKSRTSRADSLSRGEYNTLELGSDVGICFVFSYSVIRT